jgi:HD-GYP domain-containing protein (c-di-GMP phosphodiesterase class II)
MKADLTEYCSVPIEKVESEKPNPFPLYIHLKLNNRLIPLRHENESLYTKRDDLLKFSLKELWTPIYYYDRFKSLLEVEQKSEEAQLVKELLTNKELTPEVKAQALTALSQDLLSTLHKVTGNSEKDREEGLKKCKEIADEILTVAAAHDSVYDEILTMRQSKEDIEHSVAVGSLAVMFAMSLGMADEAVLADIIMAAIFHDIGLVHVKPAAREKAKIERNKAEEAEYQTHVVKSMEVLKKAKPGINERVFLMVSQHHENYDGSGYPEGLIANQIDDLSQVVNLANWFEDLTLGNITGAPIGPAEALDMIYEANSNGNEKRVSPELMERIFNFMMQQKDDFEQKKADLQKKIEAEAKKAVG